MDNEDSFAARKRRLLEKKKKLLGDNASQVKSSDGNIAKETDEELAQKKAEAERIKAEEEKKRKEEDMKMKYEVEKQHLIALAAQIAREKKETKKKLKKDKKKVTTMLAAPSSSSTKPKHSKEDKKKSKSSLPSLSDDEDDEKPAKRTPSEWIQAIQKLAPEAPGAKKLNWEEKQAILLEQQKKFRSELDEDRARLLAEGVAAKRKKQEEEKSGPVQLSRFMKSGEDAEDGAEYDDGGADEDDEGTRREQPRVVTNPSKRSRWDQTDTGRKSRFHSAAPAKTATTAVPAPAPAPPIPATAAAPTLPGTTVPIPRLPTAAPGGVGVGVRGPGAMLGAHGVTTGFSSGPGQGQVGLGMAGMGVGLPGVGLPGMGMGAGLNMGVGLGVVGASPGVGGVGAVG
eukprot:Rmarinus@m.6307